MLNCSNRCHIFPKCVLQEHILWVWYINRSINISQIYLLHTCLFCVILVHENQVLFNLANRACRIISAVVTSNIFATLPSYSLLLHVYWCLIPELYYHFLTKSMVTKINLQIMLGLWLVVLSNIPARQSRMQVAGIEKITIWFWSSMFPSFPQLTLPDHCMHAWDREWLTTGNQ
jgi:hypothetical protein